MNHQRPVLLILLAAYVFGPTFYVWLNASGDLWYKPYLLWGSIILITLWIQKRYRSNDA